MAVRHAPGMHFVRTTPKIFALADGRTERDFHKQNKFQNTLKENKFCTMVDALKKKHTITSTVLRLGTFRLAFSGSFFTSSWNGQWHNRPLGSFDMSSPLETLVREVIRSADKIYLSGTNIIHFSIVAPLARL